MTDPLPGVARAVARPKQSPVAAWHGRRLITTAFPALFLILLSLWEIVAASRISATAATEAEWRSLSAALRRDHRPGDLIVFAPGWIDPVGRHHMGDLVPIEMAARMDAARYAVVWEVSFDDARAAEARGLRPSGPARSFGPLTLRRVEQEAAVVTTDFTAAFATARVSGPARGKPATSLEEVGFAPHRCVRVVPQPDRTVRITYPAVELGGQLVGHVGLADIFTRRDQREPARLVVSVDGRVVADVTVGVDDGWVRFQAPTGPPRRAEVVFAATALGPRANDRRVCFAAEARR